MDDGFLNWDFCDPADCDICDFKGECDLYREMMEDDA